MYDAKTKIINNSSAIGTNYLQLPINAPKKHVATNQRDGQMAYSVDTVPGQNPHVNYEPSSLNGLKEAKKMGKDYTPYYNAALVRQKIERTNDFKQAGERYGLHEEWERKELIKNLVNTLQTCQKHIQDKMIELCTKCDADYGRRLAAGLKKSDDSAQKGPIGSTHAKDALNEAQGKSIKANPY